MSDGNFNRALLPHTPYASGLRMGKAQARTAFRQWLAEAFPHLTVEEQDAHAARFSRLMGE